jgi:hypothetical protein
MLPLDRRAEGVDLIFFGWDTFRYDLAISSLRLARLLRQLATNRRSLESGAGFEPVDKCEGCKTILICAHSLGAVVSRYALLRSIESDRSWKAKIGLVLFAPAHLGVAMNIAVSVVSRLSAPLRQLLSGPILHAMRHETELYQKNEGTATLTTPLAIVEAENERWIRQGRYNSDPRCWLVKGTNHKSICKPGADFTVPIEVVLLALSELSKG